MLAIDPRPGGATSNCAVNNIGLLGLAVSRLPATYGRRVLVRLDGPGFSHDLLEHIPADGGVRGRAWELSVGWSCTGKEMDAIERLPKAAWTGGIGQDGEPADDTFVADLTGLLDLGAWQEKVLGLRIIVRDELLHPRYRKRATQREKQLGRYQLIATSTGRGQISWLDARHLSHVHVENNVKQAKNLGLNRWPSRRWAVNVAWTQIVGLAANLLACYRHLALPADELRDAAPKLLLRLLHLPAAMIKITMPTSTQNPTNTMPAPGLNPWTRVGR